MTDRAAAQEAREQYHRALNLADTVWRSETDGPLDQKRLAQLREQYVTIVFSELLQRRDDELARLREENDRLREALALFDPGMNAFDYLERRRGHE